MMSTLSLRAVLELVDRVTTPLRSIDQQSRQVSQAFRQSNQALRNLERQVAPTNRCN